MRDTAKLLMVGLLTVVGVCVLALTAGVYGGLTTVGGESVQTSTM